MTFLDTVHFDNFGIFGIFDPGDCLRHCFRELKRKHPGATHRYIAAAIGMKSSASFTLMIRGRIHPSSKTIDSLAKVFGLRKEERDHLALLFEMRRMRDASARRIVRELVLERRKSLPVFTNR